MLITKQIITNILIGNDRLIKCSLFKENDLFLFTEGNFSCFFYRFAEALQLYNPNLLQIKPDFIITIERIQQERINLSFIQESIKYGNILLKHYKNVLFDEDIELTMHNVFYIKKNNLDFFIDNVLFPITMLLVNDRHYKWEELEGKRGLWRIMDDKESMPIGSEVSMNLTTAKNWIKL